MRDNQDNRINPGDILLHNFGIPPTNVELFVFGNHNEEYLHLIDRDGNICTLTGYMASNSTIAKRDK